MYQQHSSGTPKSILELYRAAHSLILENKAAHLREALRLLIDEVAHGAMPQTVLANDVVYDLGLSENHTTIDDSDDMMGSLAQFLLSRL